jgi:type III secretory pathway lipoprotein EscJ
LIVLHNSDRSRSSTCASKASVFVKHTYKEMMIPQMKKLLPDISDTIISSTCHYISNALNNESQKLVGQRKRNSTRNKTEETVSTSTTKTDIYTGYMQPHLTP